MHTQAQARMGYAFQITSIYTYIYLLFATANGKKAQKTNAKHARSPALSLSLSFSSLFLILSVSTPPTILVFFALRLACV